MNIYWAPYYGTASELPWAELTVIEPKPIMQWIAEERTSNPAHLKCFGMIEFFKNTYVLFSPMDYTLRVDPTGVVTTDDYNQTMFDNMINVRSEPNAVHRTMSFLAQYIFFSLKPVRVEAMPMFLDHSVLSTQIRIIPGTFDIGQWIRPVEAAFEVLDGVQEFKIKRGDPLLCVRFVTDEKIKLIRTENTADIQKVTSMCTELKRALPKQTLDKCYELGRVVVQRFLRKYKKCPFRRS